MIGIIITIVAVVILGGYVIAVYNRFVNLRNGIESNFKQISVALKKRLDLIGQVVDSVKGQMKFEKSTMTEITKLRSQVGGTMTPQQAKKVDATTQKFLAGLQVQVENYPQLKSNENVKQLIDSINQLEDEISRLRYVYNNTIQEYNTKGQMFPSNIVAGMFGFGKTDYLEFEETTAQLNKAPKVDL